MIAVYAKASPVSLSVPPFSGGWYLCQRFHLGPPASQAAGNELLSFLILLCDFFFFFLQQQLSRLCWLQALSRAHSHQASVPPDPGFLAGLRGCCPLRPRLPRTFLLLHSVATVSATLLFSKQECNTNVTRSSTPFHWETGPRRWPQEPPQKDSLGPSVSA